MSFDHGFLLGLMSDRFKIR